MALPQDSADAELRNDATAITAEEERASSSSSSSEEASERAGTTQQQQADDVAATPPPTQQMDRHSSSSSSDGEAVDPDRIPAGVFERDPTEASKDWSMMSTDSVFALQVAPSSDFTGFFLAHPELMDISTPPRTSMVNAEADADADATMLAPPFESIPELPEATMKGNYSFAFPNLIEDKRHSSKKVQDEPAAAAAATTEAAQEEPAPAEAEAQASSKPVAAPENEPAKCGLFVCFPCCS